MRVEKVARPVSAQKNLSEKSGLPRTKRWWKKLLAPYQPKKIGSKELSALYEKQVQKLCRACRAEQLNQLTSLKN